MFVRKSKIFSLLHDAYFWHKIVSPPVSMILSEQLSLCYVNNMNNTQIKTDPQTVTFVLVLIKSIFIFYVKISLNELSSESHETPREHSLQFMWPNSVQCGLLHNCVLTKHLCLLEPTININPSVNIKFFLFKTFSFSSNEF